MRSRHCVGWILGLGMAVSVFADSTDARCDVYMKGASTPEGSYLCNFSQRQGYVTIDQVDSNHYDFRPVGDSPGNYVDADGDPVYRKSGLGKEGVIFQLKDKSIYVYWDTSGLEPVEEKTGSPY